MSSVEERQAQRFALLRAIYDASEGKRGQSTELNDVARILGFDERHADDLATYLVDERLLKWSVDGPVVELTHAGVREVDAALLAPDEPPRLNSMPATHPKSTRIWRRSRRSSSRLDRSHRLSARP